MKNAPVEEKAAAGGAVEGGAVTPWGEGKPRALGAAGLDDLIAGVETAACLGAAAPLAVGGGSSGRMKGGSGGSDGDDAGSRVAARLPTPMARPGTMTLAPASPSPSVGLQASSSCRRRAAPPGRRHTVVRSEPPVAGPLAALLVPQGAAEDCHRVSRLGESLTGCHGDLKLKRTSVRCGFR
jgi:hypothetical protein